VLGQTIKDGCIWLRREGRIEKEKKRGEKNGNYGEHMDLYTESIKASQPTVHR
jgi:hypothetical protein